MPPTFQAMTDSGRMPVARFLVCLCLMVWLALLGACATLPEGFESKPSYAFNDKSGTFIADRAHDMAKAHPGKTGVMLLSTGVDAFVARARLAQIAERSIDAQYYLYHDDLTGRLFTKELLDAADRGVRIRLLVDDIDFGGREWGAAMLSMHPNVEVRLFNPFARNWPRVVQFATRFGSITRRMHNKSYIVDDAVAVVGGRNIGDEYFDAAPGMNFSDLDALVIGAVVNDVAASFDKYWNHELAYPAQVLNQRALDKESIQKEQQKLRNHVSANPTTEFAEALAHSSLSAALAEGRMELDWADVSLVSDDPDKITAPRRATEYHLADQLRPLFFGTREELVIISPYFVPGQAGVAFLVDLAAKGVDVKILTNSLSSTDVPIVHGGYARYRKQLLRAGIQLFESRPNGWTTNSSNDMVGGSSAASLHAKSFVFDRNQVFIGSLNLDPRSVHENTEIGLVIESTAIADEVLTWFDEFTRFSAYRLILREGHSGYDGIVWLENDAHSGHGWMQEPGSSPLSRLLMVLLRALPIESQL